MYCDGSAIPAGNTLSGNTPNLTDDRFLMGSTTAGTSSAANNSITLSVAQLPSHDHGAGTYATNTGTSVASSSHTHTTTGVAYMDEDAANNDLYMRQVTGISPTWTATRRWGFSSVADAASSVGGWSVGIETSGDTDSISGTTSLNDISIDGTSGSTGSGSAIDNRPSYFTCQYIIKVS